MTSPSSPVERVGGVPVMWLALTTAVLFATAFFHLFFVLPVFQALLASFGAEFSLPARIGFGIAQFGLVIGILWGAVFGLYVWYRKAPGRSDRLSSALGATALLLALYVGLLSCAYVDVAINLPTNRAPATAPTPAPAP